MRTWSGRGLALNSQTVRHPLKSAWPALLLMALIFVGSTDLLAAQHTSRILGPLLKWLLPGITDLAVSQVQLFLRKCGHAMEYALLAMLVWRWLNAGHLGQRRPWPVRLAWSAWAIATLYAVTDEWHQSFVPSREGQVTDVLIDSMGAALAIGFLWVWGHWRGRWAQTSPTGRRVESRDGEPNRPLTRADSTRTR